MTPSKVEVTNLTYTKNGTKITWNPLHLGCSGISLQYFLNFTNKNLLIHSSKTTNNSFSCGTECINATSFAIWAVVGNKAWRATFHDLSAIRKGESSFKNAFSMFDSRRACQVTWKYYILVFFPDSIPHLKRAFFPISSVSVHCKLMVHSN